MQTKGFGSGRVGPGWGSVSVGLGWGSVRFGLSSVSFSCVFVSMCGMEFGSVRLGSGWVPKGDFSEDRNRPSNLI